MARKDEDPRITDLARYRRARQQQQRAPKPAPPVRRSEPVLGSRPRAGLILAAVILVLALLWLLPMVR